MATSWHNKKIKDILTELQSGSGGLGFDEAKKRYHQYGANALVDEKKDGYSTLILSQLKSPLIFVLLAAAMIVLYLREFIDAFFIFFVLSFNAVVGAVQEGKAQNTLLALKKFSETNATVLRDEKEFIIPDKEVVPGDVIILQQGEKIPADARLIETSGLKIDEASLTGESMPIEKRIESLVKKDLPVSERKNMVFKGTYAVAGRGKAVVIATGLNTEIGKISKEISLIDTEIPLKKDIRDLSKIIVGLVLAASIVLFVLGFFMGKPAKEMFTTVVSLSVSIIPEGLPIVMVLVLASGVWRMAKKNVVVKRLQAVEALGQADIIAVDKTGTITKNEMMAQKVYVNGKVYEISGNGYEAKGEVKLDGKNIDPLDHEELILAGKIAAYNSDARVIFDEEKKIWRISGDPTEVATLVFAEKIGFHKNDLDNEFPLLSEIPFDSTTKYHAAIRKAEKGRILTVVGAPEIIMDLSERVWKDGKSCKFSKAEKEKAENAFLKFSKDGLRVLAFAYLKNAPQNIKPHKIQKLVFGGFYGIQDTIREEASQAVKIAESAGIKVVMITGDHKITARAIAEQVGIYKEGDEVLTSEEMKDLSESELLKKLPKVSVFARVSPEDKLKIIRLFKNLKNIIAMTGDGVNDAPSLVAADLGVGMGKIGTEVAKEASDIVILDDNFGAIVFAVEEGRNIYRTIKKVILYLFSTSAGEFLVITGAIVAGFPLPVLPAQIIWLNLVTDGFLDVALAMEPKSKNLLNDYGKGKNKKLLDSLMYRRIALMALPMMIGTLLIFRNYFEIDIVKAWTMSLTLLAVFQWFNAYNCRSDRTSVFKMNPLSNKYLLGATAIVISLQFLALYNPFLQKILKTTPLKLSEWFIIIAVALSIILVEEARKFFYRKHLAKQNKE